jgi:hypothetical protein
MHVSVRCLWFGDGRRGCWMQVEQQRCRKEMLSLVRVGVVTGMRGYVSRNRNRRWLLVEVEVMVLCGKRTLRQLER